MRHEEFPFTRFRGDLIEMDPADTFEPAELGPKFICAFIFCGSVGDHGLWTAEMDRSDKTRFTAGERREWYCLSKRKEGDHFEVRHQPVDGEFTLPAGWGFVVVRGEVDCDDQWLEPFCDYFLPREEDRSVVGNADLILIR